MHEKAWAKFLRACEKLKKGKENDKTAADNSDLFKFEQVPFPGGINGNFDDIAAAVLGKRLHESILFMVSQHQFVR